MILKIDGMDINKAVIAAEEALNSDKSISASVKAIFSILLLLIKALQNQASLNSRNSSKPPSTDNNSSKNKKNSDNECDGDNKKKRGGQTGSKGNTLRQVADPDNVVVIPVDRSKIPEGNYKISTVIKKRQIIDLVIKRFVTEFQAQTLINIDTGKEYTAEFPDHAPKAVQYGDTVKAHAVYMSQYQLLPYDRVREFFAGQMGIPLSVGSIYNFNNTVYGMLGKFESISKKALIQSPIAHVDETGINIAGKCHWLHVTSNESWTFFYPHKKRGREAMDEIDILPHFEGVLCHDHWKPYYFYTACEHSLCNAHHLRELTCAWEQEKHAWAKDMIDFLLDVNSATKSSGAWTDKRLANQYRTRYREILKKGDAQHPAPTEEDRVHKRGRIKRSKGRNLLERLMKFEDDVLRFMEESDVPFTNNLGERDVRMTKVHQKISGCFQSELGAKMFCRIRGYLSSCRKQGVTSSDAMTMLFRGELPEFAQKESDSPQIR